MIDLQSISSNLLLVGFALVSICCLYLLYSNFTKVRDINEMKNKFEDLKNIFFNQQKQNDESYIKIMSLLQDSMNTQPNTQTQPNIQSNTQPSITTKKININPKLSSTNIINIFSELNEDDENYSNDNNNNKIINLDLQELDNLSNVDGDGDGDGDEVDIDGNGNGDDEIDNLDNDSAIDGNVDKINIFEINTSKLHIEDFDDTNSITTDPIINDIDELDDITDNKHYDIDNIDNIEDIDNIDNIEDIDDIDDIDNIEDIDDIDNIEDIDDIDNLEDIDNIDNLEDIDNIDNIDDINDLDNIDELDNLDNLDIDVEDINTSIKLINIDKKSTLSDTIINNNKHNNNTLGEDVKSILFNNQDNIENTFETIELDKLLSGSDNHLSNVNVDKIDNTNVDVNNSNDSNDSNDSNEKQKLDNLQNMSIKQLKDLAKSKNLKLSGNKTKGEIIEAISKSL